MEHPTKAVYTVTQWKIQQSILYFFALRGISKRMSLSAILETLMLTTWDGKCSRALTKIHRRIYKPYKEKEKKKPREFSGLNPRSGLILFLTLVTLDAAEWQFTSPPQTTFRVSRCFAKDWVSLQENTTSRHIQLSER